ncbi:MAG: hypothetical protein WCK02_12345 [Bacteroidota bacterium]
MFKSLRLKIGKYFLNKQIEYFTRERRMTNMDDAQSIGIIYDALDQESFDIINNFIEVLKRSGKYVQVLGFVPAKRFEQDYFLKLDIHLFKYSDLNWYYKPSKQCIDDFVARDFDVLLNLSLRDEFPTQYISAISKSKLKVGKDSVDNQKILDMLITVDAEIGLKDFIRTIRHYLSMINRKDNSNYEE